MDLSLYLQQLRLLFRRPHKRTMGRADTSKTCYTDQELDEFERSMGIRLPAAYRRYLRDVGAGQPDAQHGISILEDWCQPRDPESVPRDFLRQPFPHTQAWNDLSLLDARLGWGSPYFDDNLWRGAIRLANTGCEGYHLLIVTGRECGNVWSDERAPSSKGIYPLPDGSSRRTTIEEYLAALPRG